MPNSSKNRQTASHFGLALLLVLCFVATPAAAAPGWYERVKSTLSGLVERLSSARSGTGAATSPPEPVNAPLPPKKPPFVETARLAPLPPRVDGVFETVVEPRSPSGPLISTVFLPPPTATGPTVPDPRRKVPRPGQTIFPPTQSVMLSGLDELIRSTVFSAPGVAAPPPDAKPVPPKEPELRLAALPPSARGICGRNTVAIYQPKAPIRQGACGEARPVLLRAFGRSHINVAPGATTNCSMTSALAKWADTVVAPAARRHLRGDVVSVKNMASYACRRRNNSKSGRISEHAYANALDIGMFRLSDGREINVAKHWRGGGGAQAFLREVHSKSCGVFKTVLGPNADRHHYNHFHLDLAGRRSSYCR